MSTIPSHRNNMSYMPFATVPLTKNDVARIRAQVVALGEAILWQALAQQWDLPLDRVKSLTKDLRASKQQ
jgi:hypothetical protein